MTKRLVAVVGVAGAMLASCDAFNHASARAAAPHVMVATVLHTPEIDIPLAAIAGLDASFPMFDGGIPDFDGGFPFDGGFTFDAGGFNFSLDGGITIPAQTALLAFFGTHTDLNSAPTGEPGALLTAGTSSTTWALKDQGGGTYTLTSVDDATLQYTPHVTWTFAADAGGVTFSGGVDDAPGSEHIFQLHPDAGYIELAAGTDYVLTRPDPPEGQTRDLGFVTVFPVDQQGRQLEPTYTDVPKTPLEFLKLAAAPSSWQTTIITIPGKTAFPNAQENYVILLQTAKLGLGGTDNLFLGSPIIAGAADVGVVKTH
jgi:hypothetical protein